MEKKTFTPDEIYDKVITSMESGKTQTEAMEDLAVASMSESEKSDYYRMKKILLDFKSALEQKAGYVSIVKKVEGLIKSGTIATLKNSPLENNMKKLYDSLIIAFERKALIVETANDLTTGKLVFSDNLKKYVLSNFHRTICEIVVKLFLEPLPAILDYTKLKISSSSINNDEKSHKIKAIEDRKTKLYESFDLGDLLTIILTMEKHTDINVGLGNLIKEAFGYIEGKGFLTRNNTAHERVSFAEIDTTDIFNKVMKANNFNIALVNGFFIEGTDKNIALKFLKKEFKD